MKSPHLGSAARSGQNRANNKISIPPHRVMRKAVRMSDEIERARDALSVIPPNLPRIEWHKIGRAAIAAGLTVDDIDEWSKPAENYKGRKDVEAAFHAIKPNGGTGAGTLFHIAKQYGFSAKSDVKTSRPSLSSADAKQIAPRPLKQAASGNAAQVWARCIPATEADAYVHRKQGKPDGLRVYPASAPPLVIRGQNVAGYLVVPCWDGDALQTLQFIPPNGGDKLNLPGASFADGFFPVGDIASAKKIYIVEGLGQAWAVTQADPESAALVTFGSGRMDKVANVSRAKYPGARLIIVADRGKESEAEKIAAAVSGQWVGMPDSKPGNYDTNDFLQDAGAEALAALLESPQAAPYPLSVVFGDDMPDAFTPPDEIVEGVLTAGDASVFYGDSNSGKTFFVVDMCCAIARGVQWMGKKTEAGLVVYLAAESPGSVRRRLQAYQRHNNVKVPNFAIVQSPIDLFADDADTEKIIRLVQQIEKQKAQKVRLIVGDTLSRLSAGANENAGQDMSQIVRRIDRIRTECHAHFSLIHHCGKNAAAGARGWSGVRGAVDTEIEITDTPSGRCAEITKQRDLSTKNDRIGFRLESVTLGVSKWGTPATSCIVMSTDAPPKTAGKRTSEIGGAIVEFLSARECGIKKRELVLHFGERYTSSAVYRELKHLASIGQVFEVAGIIALNGMVRNGAN